MTFYKIGLLFLFSVATTSINFAQSHLSTPMEIMSFMEASPTKYEITQLYGEAPKRKRTVLANGTFIQPKEDREYTYEYEELESKREKKWRVEAMALRNMENPDYVKIRKLFGKVLKSSPYNAQLMTYMGETYYDEANFQEARKWLYKALDHNPIDYSAHKILAEIFLKEGALDSAVQEITIAHLFNRNNPYLLTRLKEIYTQKGLNYYEDWGFDPKYHINLDTNKTVVITADGIWLTYAMYKAVWTHEPDYHYIKEQQEVSDYLFHAEMEASIGTFLTYSAMQQEDKRHFPALYAFEIALDHEMIEEYVMYEILLVDHPTLAAHLTPDFIQKLSNYMLTVRSRDAVKGE
jgi:tetratricopeptide (TPR) repeat protein